MSSLTIAISLIANDLTGGAFSGVISNASRLANAFINMKGVTQDNITTLAGLGGATLAAGLAFDAFLQPVKYGIGAAADLETRLVTLKNAVQDDTASIPLLTAAVSDMAIKTVFGTGEATDAFSRLVEMGYNTQQVMYGMADSASALMDGTYHATEATKGLGNESLIMAQAMGTDAVQGAQLLGSAMNVFHNQGLSAEQTANMLAGAFLNGVPSAEALGQAIAMSGANAQVAGISLSDYLTTLDLLTRNGLSASSAGASLNYAISSLTSPTDKQKVALKDLGLVTLGGADGMQVLSSKMFDAQGNFVGMKTAVEELDKAMIGKTTEEKLQAFADLFNIRGGKAARILANIEDFDAQYKSIAERIANTDLATMADRQLHTLQGAWDSFKDTFQSTAAIIFMPVLKYMSDFILKINDVVGAFQKLPEAARNNIALFLLVGMAISGLVFVIAGLITIVAIVIALFAAFGPIIAGVAAGVGIAVGIIAGLIALFFTLKAAIEGNKTVMDMFHTVVNIVGQALGMLRDQAMMLLNNLKLLAPVWEVLKVVLVAVAIIIGVVLVAAFLVVIGIITAVIWVIRNAIQWFAAAGTAVGNFFSMLGTFFSSIPGWAAQAWGAVQAKTMEVWNAIVSGVTGFINGIKATISGGFAAAAAIVQGAIQTVVGWFSWLYDHNYYFHDLVDAIKAAFNNVKSFITSTWQSISSFLSSTWNTIRTTAGNAFQAVGTAIHNALTTAQSAVSSAANAIKGVLSAAWGAIQSAASGAWNSFVGIIRGAVGGATSAANSIKSGVVSVIQSLGGALLGAGANAVHMLASGIAGAAGAVIAQAQSIANKVKAILGFHSPPPEGPLADSDTYMPNMMKMYAAGIEDHLPLITGKIGTVASTLGKGVVTPSVAASASSGVGPYAATGTVQIPINLDGKQIAQYSLDLQSRKLTMVGGARYAR